RKRTPRSVDAEGHPRRALTHRPRPMRPVLPRPPPARPPHRPTARRLLQPSPAHCLVASHARDPRPTTPTRVPHLRAHHLALVATAQRMGVIRGRRRQRDDPPPHLRRSHRPARLAPPTPRHTAHLGVPRRTGGTPHRPQHT